MLYNWIGFIVISALALIAAAIAGARQFSPWPQRLLLAAIGLRILGSTVRYQILFDFYKGFGDAVRYYNEGLLLADSIRTFQITPFSAEYWAAAGSWWGTSFLIKLSGLVLSIIGPTMRGTFLVFSLLAFLGLLALAAAFRNVQPGSRSLIYATWIFFWPSLWFWPSSLGKESVLMLAMGLATLGYAGKGGNIRWPLFAAGLGLAFCIRPHVAAVLAIAALGAHWLGTWDRVTPRRVLEALAAVILVIVALSGMATQFGLQPFDVEGMQQFVVTHSVQTLQGGSNIGVAPISGGGIPLAFVNIWMRPFLWETHNATSLFAAIELLLFWWLIWYRRRTIRVALKNWRRHRLLRFALPLIVVYTLMIGLAFGNLGLIARQRAPIFPFMFMIVLAAPDPRAAAGRKGDAPRREAVARAKAA